MNEMKITFTHMGYFVADTRTERFDGHAKRRKMITVTGLFPSNK